MQILLVLLAVSSISSAEPPPKRIDLFRFFMGFGPEESPVQKVSFNPEAGLRFREQYEKKYGPRGQLLIERFGQGLAMQGPSVVDVDQLLDVVRSCVVPRAIVSTTELKFSLERVEILA